MYSVRVHWLKVSLHTIGLTNYGVSEPTVQALYLVVYKV